MNFACPCPSTTPACSFKSLRRVAARLFVVRRRDTVRLLRRKCGGRGGRRRRGGWETPCLLFPPPLVDITSKTWPSFADMLLRRRREGGTFGVGGRGGSGIERFPAPPCHISNPARWRRRRPPQPRLAGVLLIAGTAAIRECNFGSPTLFMHFDFARL